MKATYDPNLKDVRRRLRNSMTKSETIFWKYVKSERLGFKFRRQVNIKNYIVDFYCARLRLIVEIDGLTHYDESVFEQDLKRDKDLKKAGFVVLRFNSDLVFNKLNEVLAVVYETCAELQKAKNSPS